MLLFELLLEVGGIEYRYATDFRTLDRPKIRRSLYTSAEFHWPALEMSRQPKFEIRPSRFEQVEIRTNHPQCGTDVGEKRVLVCDEMCVCVSDISHTHTFVSDSR